MKKIFTALALVALASSAFAGRTDHNGNPPNNNLPACNIVADVQMDAIACYSITGQNDDGAPNLSRVLGELNSNFDPLTGAHPDDPWSLVKHFGGGDEHGTLTFDTDMFDFFAVSLKAGNGYNVYLFDAPLGVGSISYSIAKDLSHANLWTFDQLTPVGVGCGPLTFPCDPGTVPEPAGMALTATALLGAGIVGRRRKLKVVSE